MNHRVRWTGVLLLVLTVLPASVAFAAGGSSIVVDDAAETPSQTITLHGEEYTVSSVGRVSQGDPLTARPTAPSNVTYVHLYDTDGSILMERGTSVNESVTFETANLTPGEYLLATHNAGHTFYAVKPVVVTGYNTSLSTATASTSDGRTTFSVRISETSNVPAADSVEVVAQGDDGFTRTTASKTGDGSYTAAADLKPGEYEVYAVVRADGERVGLSKPTTVTVVEESSTATDTPNETTATTASTTTTTASNETTDNGQPSPFDGVDTTLLTNLSNSKLGTVVTSLNTPSVLVSGLLAGLVVSTVLYQAVYTLRRR